MCLENVIRRGAVEVGRHRRDFVRRRFSSRMPMVRQMLAQMSGKTPLLHDPDECVAKGAALQAAMLTRHQMSAQAMQVNHVLPHTLGVATMRQNEAIVEAVVPALTPLPCANAREEFTTTMDNQTQVSVQVYEGEAADPKLPIPPGRSACFTSTRRRRVRVACPKSASNFAATKTGASSP